MSSFKKRYDNNEEKKRKLITNGWPGNKMFTFSFFLFFLNNLFEVKRISEKKFIFEIETTHYQIMLFCSAYYQI